MARCPFCSRPADSREHLWADWINDAFGPTRYTFRRREKNGTLRHWYTDKIGEKTWAVCARCNNGWMSDLENNEARPVLKDMIVYGAALSLLPRGIASLAAYAFKTAVIASQMRSDRTKFFTRSACATFAKTLHIPPNIQMWIAAMKSRANRSGKFKSTYGKTPKGFILSFELYVFTLAIGHVVLQLVATRFRKPRLFFRGVVQDSKWDDFSVRLWPSDGDPVLWPPKEHLADDTIQTFCDRWRDFDVPRWMTNLSD